MVADCYTIEKMRYTIHTLLVERPFVTKHNVLLTVNPYKLNTLSSKPGFPFSVLGSGEVSPKRNGTRYYASDLSV
jgi:hypothetical protein